MNVQENGALNLPQSIARFYGDYNGPVIFGPCICPGDIIQY